MSEAAQLLPYTCIVQVFYQDFESLVTFICEKEDHFNGVFFFKYLHLTYKQM